MKITKQFTDNQKRHGIALIWVMLLFMVLIGIAGLLIDLARIYLTAQELHNTADAAALAGSRYVSVYGDPNYPDARAKAQEYAAVNYVTKLPVNLDLNMGNIDLDPDENGNLAGDIVIGRYIMQYATDDDPDTEPFLVMSPSELLINKGANAMKVVARKDGIINQKLSLLFGPIFGIDDVGIRRYAIAFTYNASGAGLIALAHNPDQPGLLIHGTPYLNVNGGSIQVNSIDVDALTLKGQSIDINAQDINITGDFIDKGFDVGEDIVYNDITSSLNTGMPAEPDPYELLPEPVYSDAPEDDLSPKDPNTGEPMLLKVTTGETVTVQPGYYSMGIQNNGGVLIMEPGIYHLGGDTTKNVANGGLKILGGDLYANGVLLHIVDNGELYLGGNGHIEVSPYQSDPYKDFSIFQSRDNDNEATIIGTGDLDLAGKLYFPENHVEVQGNGDSIGTQLIAYTIGIGGTGEVIINYNGKPEPANKSYLVE
ncbi:MAG: pilus assembly protein TadG-related protein [Phycisphaerae bacterium]|nr:pilus assembly protein TadG-related protein [Phycisphaerae bacterium]